MRLLIVADSFPHPDKASGHLRLYSLLQILAGKHEVVFCALDGSGSIKQDERSSELLRSVGVRAGCENLQKTLQTFRPEIVWFEFFYSAISYCDLIRRTLPDTIQVIDSVDVHFNRLTTLARLTGNDADWAKAAHVKQQELAAYAASDVVIAVSADDKKILKKELPSHPVEVVPNIHKIPALPDVCKRQFGELVFVGSFGHEPNIDAAVYLCKDIMPLILGECPTARLKIIGSNPTAEILNLASDHVDVLGYIPDTAPFLERAYISVAPLRYGGGMKGKVGEAMSFGLPVVTSSYGAEGFGLEPGRDLLVGNNPEDFAEHVIRLLDDSELYGRIGRNGRNFIETHYSVAAAERLIESVMDRIKHLPRKKLALRRRLQMDFERLYERHIAWRFGVR
jgi:glycosyltransferase involved in cell wall biosynthesis